MTSYILFIGLNTPLIEQLNLTNPSRIIATESCDEAIKAISLWDITMIVFDSKISLDVKADVEKLLSATPITTRILLITAATDLIANENYSNLGIATVTGPISDMNLGQYFS